MRAPTLLLFLLAATLPAQTEPLETDFSLTWPQGVDRPWPGPETFANRFQDWRVRGGRLHCTHAERRRPLRTIHLLTRVVGPEPGAWSTSVTLGADAPDLLRGPEHWAGFLIGVGGDHVDFRTSALCHQWPARDGGLLAVVDGTGRATLRDNSRFSGRRPSRLDAWPVLARDASRGEGATRWKPGEALRLDLRVTPEPGGETSRCELTVRRESGEEISRVRLDGVPDHQVAGQLALVSHSWRKRRGPGHWFGAWGLSGPRIKAHPERAFGPVWVAMHTLSRGVLKMTAQFPPLGEADVREAALLMRRDGDPAWSEVARAPIVALSETATFRVPEWDGSRRARYRVRYRLRTGPESHEVHDYSGTIRADDPQRDTFTLAALSCHHISAAGSGDWNFSGFWYPHNDLVAAVERHRPDMVFFAGDQIYEGGLAGIVRRPVDVACVDYLYHWVNWCWAFRDLVRDVPSVCIPDDHDVYHGNIWGAGGRRAVKRPGVGRYASDSGGYMMHPRFVNAVHRTQTSHLPDPVDATPIAQDISVYTTRIEYGGLSFAVLADRMWKSAPSVVVPEGRCENGWFQAEGFDPRTQADVPGAVLLGARQLRFLDDWAQTWDAGTWMKVALSQTIFANVATLPQRAASGAVLPGLAVAGRGELVEGDRLAADADSNGWPQSGRNRALRALRRGFALHVAGDQHLSSLVHYGVDAPRDAGVGFCVPAVANVWPRRWFPPMAGLDRRPGASPVTGDFRDGFGNHVRVLAVANPQASGAAPKALYDRMPGYGILRFDRRLDRVWIESWPRHVDPAHPAATPYEGWPRVVSVADNYARRATHWLPELRFEGLTDPVIQVVSEADGEVVYTRRIRGSRFRPGVFAAGQYTVHAGRTGRPREVSRTGLVALSEADERVVTLRF